MSGPPGPSSETKPEGDRMRLDIQRIEAAALTINQAFLNTPQYVCERLSRMLGCRIVLKVETLNPVRCFKGRGAEVVLRDCSREAR